MMEDNCDLWRAYESGLETTTSFGSNLNSTPDGLVPYRKHNFNQKLHLNIIDSSENFIDDNRIVKKEMREKRNWKDSELNHRHVNSESSASLNAQSKSVSKKLSQISRRRDRKESFGNSVGDKDHDSSADSQSNSESQPQRVWKIELRREDMQLFDDSEAKLFRKLLRKLVRNNGSTVSAVDVTPQQFAANQKARSKSTSDSLQQSSQRKTKRRKRKIITRRDKNGVVTEKIYKPYEGEEDKEDVIVKYENGQPVASYTASQLASIGKDQAGSDGAKYHKLTNGSIDSSDPFGSSSAALSNNIQALHTSQADSTNALDSRDSASVDSSSETSSTKYPRRKRKNIYDESELNLPKSKYVAPLLNLSSVLTPVVEIGESKPDENEKTKTLVENLTNCATGELNGDLFQKPVHKTNDLNRIIINIDSERIIKLPTFEPKRTLEKAQSESETSNNTDKVPVNDVSSHINHMFSKPEETLTVKLPDGNEQAIANFEKSQKEEKVNIPGTMPAKFSARTKFVTTKKESGMFVDFDYFDRSSHSHGSSKLIQFLSDGGITKKGDIVDPYDCCEMLERALKLKRYKDELSESSSDESCADSTKPEMENQEKRIHGNDGAPDEKTNVRTKPKEGGSASEETTKKSVAESKAKAKTKGKKLNKKNSKNALGRFDSDDENAKSIVDKISRRYKADKDDKTTSGQGLPHIKLPKANGEDETESCFSLINPGEDKVAQTLQFEQSNSMQLSNETAVELLRHTSGASNNFCALCRLPPSNELGALYGPYIFSHVLSRSNLLTNGVTGNSSRCFSDTKTSTVPTNNSSNDGTGQTVASCIHCATRSSRQVEGSDQKSPESCGQGQVWLHGQCLLWSPVTCLVASQLLSIEQTLEAVVESVSETRSILIEW